MKIGMPIRIESGVRGIPASWIPKVSSITGIMAAASSEIGRSSQIGKDASVRFTPRAGTTARASGETIAVPTALRTEPWPFRLR